MSVERARNRVGGNGDETDRMLEVMEMRSASIYDRSIRLKVSKLSAIARIELINCLLN